MRAHAPIFSHMAAQVGPETHISTFGNTITHISSINACPLHNEWLPRMSWPFLDDTSAWHTLVRHARIGFVIMFHLLQISAPKFLLCRCFENLFRVRMTWPTMAIFEEGRLLRTVLISLKGYGPPALAGFCAIVLKFMFYLRRN